MSRLAFFFALSLLALSPFASADIPHLISLQGKLTDASNNPLTSTANFVFRIYTSQTGGTPAWTETQNSIPLDTLGIFSVLLGSANALSIPFDSSYWLEVQVQSGTGPTQTLSPRQRMGSAGYALRAENPWNATGNNIYTTNAGNVGIGTSAPTEKLEVAGNVKATAFKGDGSQLTGISSSQWANSGSNIYYNTGNVGIGTASPGAKLDVQGGNILTSGTVIASSFSGAGTGLTGTAGGLTSGSANSVPWSGVTSKPTTVAGYGITDMGSQSVNYANSAGSAPLKHYKAFASCYAESRGCGTPVCVTEPVPTSCPAGYTQTYYADKDNIPALPPLGDYDYNFPVRDTALFDAGPWAVHYADVKDMYGVVIASATTGAVCGNCAICAYRVCVQN